MRSVEASAGKQRRSRLNYLLKKIGNYQSPFTND